MLGDVTSATEGAAAPAVAPIATKRVLLKLTIGDVDEHPAESIEFEVEVQKATQKAAGKSMGKMRKGAWDRTLAGEKERAQTGTKRRRDEDEEEEPEEADGNIMVEEAGRITTQKVRLA